MARRTWSAITGRRTSRSTRLPPSARHNCRAWGADWVAHDLAEPHRHLLGPFAVWPTRREGVSAASCSKLSRSWSPNARDGLPGDRHSAKRPLLRALRFEVVGQDKVLGIECTFTSRKPTGLQTSPLTNDSTVYPAL